MLVSAFVVCMQQNPGALVMFTYNHALLYSEWKKNSTSPIYVQNLCLYLYPQQSVCGGYTVFTLSVCQSVRNVLFP